MPQRPSWGRTQHYYENHLSLRPFSVSAGGNRSRHKAKASENVDLRQRLFTVSQNASSLAAEKGTPASKENSLLAVALGRQPEKTCLCWRRT
jgi:hypothetical protein